jgi:hypothetical protein
VGTNSAGGISGHTKPRHRPRMRARDPQRLHSKRSDSYGPAGPSNRSRATVRPQLEPACSGEKSEIFNRSRWTHASQDVRGSTLFHAQGLHTMQNPFFSRARHRMRTLRCVRCLLQSVYSRFAASKDGTDGRLEDDVMSCFCESAGGLTAEALDKA